MAFEIGPRMNQKDDYYGDQPAMPAHRTEAHTRVINGTEYIFGRITYDNGLVAVQALIRGQSTKEKPDVHYWTNEKEGA